MLFRVRLENDISFQPGKMIVKDRAELVRGRVRDYQGENRIVETSVAATERNL